MARPSGKIAAAGNVMDTFLAYCKMLAPVVAAVSAALTPFEGKHAWFVGVVAGANAITLVSPTLLPPRTPKQS